MSALPSLSLKSIRNPKREPWRTDPCEPNRAKNERWPTPLGDAVGLLSHRLCTFSWADPFISWSVLPNCLKGIPMSHRRPIASVPRPSRPHVHHLAGFFALRLVHPGLLRDQWHPYLSFHPWMWASPSAIHVVGPGVGSPFHPPLTKGNGV